MRTCAFIVVLAATLVTGCGDDVMQMPTTLPNLCSNGAIVDGVSCGAGMVCRASMCVSSSCGDGVVAADEECDDANMVGGDGCEANCKFTCLSSDSARNCAPADACSSQGVCTDTHVCVAGTPMPDGLACGTAGNVCNAGVCSLCSNGVRDPGEDCDDGNALNLDGCDSACRFEQAARITSLVQQFGTDTFCTKNAFGTAVPDQQAQNFVQLSWSFPVSTGDISVVFKFLGSIDPSGARSTFKLGFVDAMPVNPQDPVYSGAADLDWWYLRTPASADATETPRVQLAGEVTDRHLTAGPGTISSLRLLFLNQPANVALYNAKIDAFLDEAVSSPLVATANMPPGHLASENLSPDFQTFESSSMGAMCSDVSAKSLADTLLPLLLTPCSDPSDPTKVAFKRDQDNDQDPTNNHLLDAFIFGCDLDLDFDPSTPPIHAFVPKQPDGSLDGATYVFSVDPTSHQVTGCTKNDQSAALPNCLANATYSSYFTFGADRVIIRRELPVH